MDPALLLTRAEQEAMIAQWTPFAYSIANKFYFKSRRWLSFEECQTIAVEGLWEGARRFQPAMGNKFGTYAMWWVNQCLHRARRKAMGVPCHLKRDTDGFAAAAKVAIPLSVDAEYPGKDRSSSKMVDFLAAPKEDRPEFPADFWERVDKWLDPVKRQVIRLRFRDDLTLEEVGSVLGLTRERIRQHEAAALNQLRTRADFGDCVDDLELTRKL